MAPGRCATVWPTPKNSRHGPSAWPHPYSLLPTRSLRSSTRTEAALVSLSTDRCEPRIGFCSSAVGALRRRHFGRPPPVALRLVVEHPAAGLYPGGADA